jgi:hypothetical protein
MELTMSLRTRIARAVELFLSGKNLSTTKILNEQYRSTISSYIDENNQKIRELESLVCGLSAKVTILSDKVHLLNERIVDLTTLHEELLYTIDQGRQEEDKVADFNLNSVEKKHGWN